jgi:hypothetical protein
MRAISEEGLVQALLLWLVLVLGLAGRRRMEIGRMMISMGRRNLVRVWIICTMYNYQKGLRCGTLFESDLPWKQ